MMMHQNFFSTYLFGEAQSINRINGCETHCQQNGLFYQSMTQDHNPYQIHIQMSIMCLNDIKYLNQIQFCLFDTGYYKLQIQADKKLYKKVIIKTMISKLAIHTFFIKPMNQELEYISVLKQILIIQKNGLQIYVRITKYLTLLYTLQYRSSQIIDLIYSIREEIIKDIKRNQQSKQMSLMADRYLCLALISQITNCESAEDQYKLAQLLNRYNPQVNLNLALIIYQKKQFKNAIKLINSINIEMAFKQKHRINILCILRRKASENIYTELLKPRKRGMSNNQLQKIQFIKKLIKFKQLFLYECTTVEHLSQFSYYTLAYLFYYTNRFNDGLTFTYKLKNSNYPPTPIIQQHLAGLFYLFGQFDKSIDCAKQGLEIDPKNQQTYNWLILSLIHTRQYSQAKFAILNLIKTNQYNGTAYQYLGILLLFEGQYQMGLLNCKIAMIIKPSSWLYLVLAYGFSKNRKLAQIQLCYMKSIQNQPNELNFSLLGQFYLSQYRYLSAIICLTQSINSDLLAFRSYYFLGLIAKKDRFLMSLINKLMSYIYQQNHNNAFFLANFNAYKFISKQSKHEIYSFLINFIQEKLIGSQQTIYSDIAFNLTKQFRFNSSFVNNDMSFAIMMGSLLRSKGQFATTHRIYDAFVKEYASSNDQNLYAAFTEIYQKQIIKTPESVQALMLQFIVAEMVPINPQQALKCFHKALSYAKGDYKQFYDQIYNKIQQEIDQFQTIEFMTNFIGNQQQLHTDEYEQFIEVMNRSEIKDITKYLFSFQKIEQIKRSINMEITNHSFNSQQILDKIFNLKSYTLNFRFQDKQKIYKEITQQIQKQDKCFISKINNISKICKQKGQIKNLVYNIYFIVEEYSDAFALNQKVKLIFNHFYPYIIIPSCHRQFSVILHKIKGSFYKNYNMLREDLQNMFKEGNKHTNKMFKVEKNQKLSQTTFDNSNIFDFSQLSFSSETMSQFQFGSTREQHMLFYDKQKSESKIQSPLFKDNKQRNIIQDQKSRNAVYMSINTMNRQNQESSQIDSSQESLQYYHSSAKQYSEAFYDNQWFQLSYYPQRTLFSCEKLYAKFNELLHLNIYYIIHYLSRQNLSYIAKHILEPSNLPKKGFKAKVQLGDQISISKNSRGGLQMQNLQWIRMAGINNILSWIIDCALGISELQNLGIFHADLSFRNTIRVTKENGFHFKIIDFDKAFKVHETGSKDSSFECTKNMFDFWLRFRFDYRHSRAPIYDSFYSVSSKSLSSSSYYDPKDIISYIFMGAEQSQIQQLLAIKNQSIFSNSNKIKKCLILLRQHMLFSHLKQYSQLVQQLIQSNRWEVESNQQSLDTSIRSGIKNELQILKKGYVDYIQFARRIKKMRGYHRLKTDDEDSDY